MKQLFRKVVSFFRNSGCGSPVGEKWVPESVIIELLDALPCPVWISELRTKIITYSNPAFRKTFGENSAASCHQLVHAEEVPCEDCFCEGSPREGSECKVFKNKQLKKWFHCASSVYEQSSILEQSITPFSKLHVLFDVTVHRETQELLTEKQAQWGTIEQARQKMEQRMLHAQKLESLGVLAGGLAHDFNNLMIVIIGNTHLALKDTPVGSPAYEALSEVRRASNRASELSAKMLAFSEEGQFSGEELDLIAVLEEDRIFLTSAISKKTELTFETPENPVVVQADRSQLTQLILNLVVNASESLNDRAGEIVLRIGARRFAKDDLQGGIGAEKLIDGDYAYIEVADSGSGVPLDSQQSIFDPFFSTKLDSRGLGLSAVSEIAKAHGGYLFLESKEGLGSTFRVLLPTPGATGEAEDRVSSPDSGLDALVEGKLVLVVDDEQMVRSLVARIFENAGYTVISVENGSDALTVIGEQGADISLILLDMNMPKMDGEETFRRLREIDPKVPVIISSGYHPGEAALRILADEKTLFLKKPYRPAEVIKCANRLL